MSNDSKVLIDLMRGDVPTENRCLFDVLQEVDCGCRGIGDIGIYQLLQLNDLAYEDPGRYFLMIEQTIHQGCAYAMLSILVRGFFYGSMDERFNRLVKNAGRKGLALMLKAIILEYCNPQCVDEDNEELINMIIRSRADLRSAIMLSIVSILIYETQGGLEDLSGRDRQSEVLKREMAFLRKITDSRELYGNVSFDEFRDFFGLERTLAEEGVQEILETGRDFSTDERYAAALMVARQLELNFPDDVYEKLICGALNYNSHASIWRIGSWRILSAYLADAFVGLDDLEFMWQQISRSMIQTLHRQSHQYYLGDSTNTDRSELYLCFLPNFIERLLSKHQVALAVQVWMRAWNDCLTALYSWILPTVPFQVVQMLFYHKVMDMPKNTCSLGSLQLLNDLPCVFLPGGQVMSTADACVQTVLKNCKDFTKIKNEDPEFYKVIGNCEVNAERFCAG